MRGLMSGLIGKFFGVAAICLFIVYLLASVFRNARRLDRRITEFKKEQEELKNSGVVLNPMQELAQLYNENYADPSSPPRPARQRRPRRNPGKHT